ncbi:MAG: hypothetical protein U5K27_04735 [Desulfotignum sp.]|nr:hypothetical protein [Desulfotignum sp.]
MTKKEDKSSLPKWYKILSSILILIATIGMVSFKILDGKTIIISALWGATVLVGGVILMTILSFVIIPEKDSQ